MTVPGDCFCSVPVHMLTVVVPTYAPTSCFGKVFRKVLALIVSNWDDEDARGELCSFWVTAFVHSWDRNAAIRGTSMGHFGKRICANCGTACVKNEI